MASDHPGGLTREHVVWAYRLLLDRDPENEDVIGPKLAGSRNTAELRHHLITSAEYQRQESRLRAHQRSDARHQGARRRRAAVHRSVGPRHRPEHPARPVRTGRNPVRAEPAEAGRHGHRRRRAHRILHDAHGGRGGTGGQRVRLRAVRRERGPAGAIAAENRFGDRVVFQRAAVGATTGTATLTFPVETLNSGGAYLLRNGTAPLAGNQKKDVPVVALDALDIRRPVRFIKMDVEGAEPQVVRGAARLLREDRPIILSELHPTQLDRASGVTARPVSGTAARARLPRARRPQSGRPGSGRSSRAGTRAGLRLPGVHRPGTRPRPSRRARVDRARALCREHAGQPACGRPA